MSSLQVSYLIKSKLVSHEPLDLDKGQHALQKCQRDLGLFSEENT
jgi:hypothetical protein